MSPNLTAAEGMLLGTAAKMFTIAGPVIVYGVSVSVVYGLIYWIVQIGAVATAPWLQLIVFNGIAFLEKKT